MAVLRMLLFIICICGFTVCTIMAFSVSSARKRHGDFDKYNRLYKIPEQIQRVAFWSGVAFCVIGFWTQLWTFKEGLKVTIVFSVLAFITFGFVTMIEQRYDIEYKTEEIKKKFYDGAAKHVLAHKRNEMGYLINDGPCPVCGRDSIGVEPYRYFCPYCKLIVEITDDDVLSFHSETKELQSEV